MKKMLLWIGMGCAMYVPLHATSDGASKKVLAVAGYVRQTSPHYVPPYLLDWVYRYWVYDQRTKIGEALPLTGFQGLCMPQFLAFVPPHFLVTIGFDTDESKCALIVWHVKKNAQIFAKTYDYFGSFPCRISYLPHDRDNKVILDHTDKTLSCLMLPSYKEVPLSGQRHCCIGNLVPCPDGQGFVTLGSNDGIQEILYWDVTTYALVTRFASPKLTPKALYHQSLLAWTDTDHFATVPCYRQTNPTSLQLYIYHKNQKNIARQVTIPLTYSWYTYNLGTGFCVGKWLLMPTEKGFWCCDMATQASYHASYAYEGKHIYNVLPMDSTQFVLITSEDKGQASLLKATLCELEALHESVRIKTHGSQVIAEDTRLGGINHATVILLGTHFLFKSYGGETTLYPLT